MVCDVWDKLGDLPLHPLAVHAPVILLPLLAGVAIAYAVIPPWRRYLTWAFLGLAVIAPASATVAVLSGRELERDLGATKDTDKHQDFGELTWYLAIVLGVAALALWAIEFMRKRGKSNDGGTPILRVGSIVLSVVIVLVAVVTIYYVIKTGHSGAQMRWKGVLG